MSIGWFFSKNLSAADELVDQFSDSKFGMDKWSSFAREIIQNSLDAQDDENKPVEVTFDLNKDLSLGEIPGGEETRRILTLCMGAATNAQTKNAYKVGIDVLSRDKVYCLKVSDKNTIGVRTGRDQAWGALVFDSGRSVKQRPGSAGSHGVGSKVPFIISSCNTVFYATKNKYSCDGVDKSDCLFQGKTALINWVEENGERKCDKGWYGDYDENEIDPRNSVKPIEGQALGAINDYFVRKKDYGTDVIIVGINAYENEEIIKRKIISSILENFFVAIFNDRLVVNVFGESINKESFISLMGKYYENANETKNGLRDCVNVYFGEPAYTDEIENESGEKLGDIRVYFGLGNENSKKYYTVIRSHGMRIHDYRVNKAGQPYTAVVLIGGEKLNKLLSELENAAHDDFVTWDENVEIDAAAVYALDQVKRKVHSFIVEATKIDSSIGQEIDGLSSIIDIPGIISSVRKKNGTPEVKRNKLPLRGKGRPGVDYRQGVGGVGGGTKKRKKHEGENKPAQAGGRFDVTLYDNFASEPLFIKNDVGYVLKFSTREDVNKADLRILAINSEGKQDDSISMFIDDVYIDGTRRKYENGRISNIKISKEKLYEVKITTKEKASMQLIAEIYSKGDENNG